jgi:RNA polymerase sigma factor (sigma-70 family)
MQGQLKMTKRDEDKELKQYEAMIRKIASQFNLKYNNKYDIEDLQQAARLGVLAAIRNYDPKFATKKITHYYNYARFYISHQIRSDTGIIHIPVKPLSNPDIQKPSVIELKDYNVSSSTGSTIDALENKITLDEHFDSLTDYQKDVIRKVYLEGYTYNEVANSYNVTRQAVNIVANNGLSKLKNLLLEKPYK